MTSRDTLLKGTALCWRAGGRNIVGPVDFALRRGESVVVVGANGAGKTTLLRLVTGLLEPSAGELFWNEQPYATFSRKQLAQRVAYVPQLRPVRIPLTVRELVLLGRFPHQRRRDLGPSSEDYHAVRQALERVGLEQLAERPLDKLSGGERQAAFIAAALAQEAGLLVLDEPTTFLDPGHQRQVASLVQRLRRSGAHTVLCATHDLNFASLIADRVVALEHGKVMAAGSPQEILSPAVLERLFAAPFDSLPGQHRLLPVLRLEG